MKHLRPEDAPVLAETASPPVDRDSQNRNIPLPTPGAAIWIRQQRWLVERAAVDTHVIRIDAERRGHRRTFLLPFDRAHVLDRRVRPRRVARQRALARVAGLLARRASCGVPLALLDADVELLPYQIEPALAVLAGHRRLLLADEVGLGKTIQAGLVINELARRLGSVRVLVLVPAALRDQWAGELVRRFRITPQLVDRSSLADQVRSVTSDENPWQRSGVLIGSVDYIKQPHVLASLPGVCWDLVVIDEAHDACGDSGRHDACAFVCRSARRVMLLTATPHSGDQTRFNRLTALGRLADLADDLVTFRRTRLDVGIHDTRRPHWRRISLTPSHARVLDVLMEFERAVLRHAGPARDAPLLLLSVLRKRALSTLSAFEASLSRRLSALEHAGGAAGQATWSQDRLPFGDDDVVGGDERAALMVESGLARAHECTWLRRLHRLAASAVDARLAHVCRLLSRTCEPVIVFTEFRHSAEVLLRHLVGRRRVTAIHGGQSPAERSAALASFTSGDASVLIATDVAGQGLNLQMAARWVINLELPWTPLTLEQRVGRVARLGQTRRVHMTVLLARHAAEDALVSRVGARVLAARRSVGAEALSWAVYPDERAVAAAVVDGQDLPWPEDSSRPDLPRKWTRPARAIARVVRSRRVLMTQWRASSTGAARPWLATRSQSGRNGVLVVLSVPLVDGNGAELERVLVSMCVSADALPDVARPDGHGLITAADRAIAARVRRVTRLVVGWTEGWCAVERAIEQQAAHRRQTGTTLNLFDRQDVRALEALRQAADARHTDAEERIRAWQRARQVTTGPPRLEVIVRGWPR